MVVFSLLRSTLLRNVYNSTNGRKSIKKVLLHNHFTHLIELRFMSGGHHRVLPIQPSRFQWNKFKDLFHYYLMVGIIPVGLVVLYSNIFIGPATLSEIPEGYEPKYWEYYRVCFWKHFELFVVFNCFYINL